MPIGQLLVGPLVLFSSTGTVELGSVAVAVVVTAVALTTPAIANLRLTGTAIGAADDQTATA
jgi:hypothetical protein